MAEVWTFVSPLGEHGCLDRGRQRRPSEDVGVGTRFSSTHTYRGESFDVEYEAPAHVLLVRLDITSREGPFPFDGSFRLVESDDRTGVSNTIGASSDSCTITHLHLLRAGRTPADAAAARWRAA